LTDGDYSKIAGLSVEYSTANPGKMPFVFNSKIMILFELRKHTFRRYACCRNKNEFDNRGAVGVATAGF